MPHTDKGTGWQRTDTSRDAAIALDANVTRDVTIIRARVLQFLTVTRKAFTSEELATYLDIDYRSIQPRLSELRDEGKVRDSGQRRLSSRNRNIICWEITRD